MALGGGTWTNQDKVLPGTYINFINPARADAALAARGIVAVPLTLDWGKENTMLELTADSVADVCKKTLGYELDEPQMLPIRELFKNAKKVLLYRLEKNGAAATNTFAKAKYHGIRGNDLTTVISSSVDREGYFNVITLLDGIQVDAQEVSAAAELQDNDFVVFQSNSELAETAGLPLTGGTGGDAVTGTEYQAFLLAAESYSYNILCCPAADQVTVKLFAAYTKRMCTESGASFQLVCYRPQGIDWEGVIGLENKVLESAESGLVYWVAGAQAACELNRSLTGKAYDGELAVDLSYSQNDLKAALSSGKFMFHGVNGVPRVLRDINTLVSFTPKKSEDFSLNQIVRVCGALGTRIAELFNGKYLGVVANDDNGRVSLWADICQILGEYRDAHAIGDFDTSNVSVLPGDNKKSVLCRINSLLVSGAMEALYMDIIIQ